MTGKKPHAAFCEEYDEDKHIIRPETRQVAHIATKRSKTDLKPPSKPVVDGASDSGYSSRTAATVNSAQSGPSGRKSPVPLKPDSTPKRADLEKIRSVRKDRTRENPATRPVREDKMQVGAHPGSGHYAAPVQRSQSRSRRRDSVHMRHIPGTCWECDNGLYHPPTPIEPPRRMEQHPYYTTQPPPGHDYPHPPPSPQTRYPPSVTQDIHVSRPSARSTRSNSYHSNGRPSSFHGLVTSMGAMGYPPPPTHYDHGPPISASAYANSPAYAASHYPLPTPYYAAPEYAALPPAGYHQERSVAKTAEKQPRPRRPSMYGPPVVEHVPPTPPYDESEEDDDEEDDDEEEEEEDEEEEEEEEEESDNELLSPSLPPPPNARQARPRPPTRDDDWHRMPPSSAKRNAAIPPPPMKQATKPHIIQKRPGPPRKLATTHSITSDRRSSRAFDMSDMDDALSYGYRRSSRETIIPERSQSLRGSSRRSTTYHESVRPSRMAIEGARRQRTSVYDSDSGNIEIKQRDAEDYQKSTNSKVAAPVAAPVPLTEAALRKAKSSRAESDSGSQKSRSSRGSDARTQTGSGGGDSKPEEDDSIVMTMNGITMSFPQKSMEGKMISLRTGDTGEVELNIAGKRPKKYLTNGSDYTSSVSRRELEDSRRPRNDRRSDKGSRSSASMYGRY